ncbi:MAG: phosphomannose isomerase type II C-terminal cupin domain [Acidobacteriia bacterium]|nr:phosphomannose isomerase type II C-terminal cupin domain [Terriglobia bacterium]
MNKKSSSAVFDHRPWGSFTVLDEGNGYKVKRIEVLPGKRLSYQKHAQRAEHWMVVQGRALVTLDGLEISLSSGGTIDIPRGSAHRIKNQGVGMLVFIEVQRGSYLGEDDIARLEDDYGRVKK